MIARAKRTPSAYLVLFASLYAVQGVVVAYLFNFNKPFMMSQGMTPDRIGLVQTLALLPLVLKFLVGPVSDRYNLFDLGHRKPYILIGLLAQAGGLAVMAFLGPGTRIGFFASAAVTTVIGLSVYDTACDGMVIDMTPESDRARVQGWLWTWRFVSATVVTLGFGYWLDFLGGPSKGDRLLLASATLTLFPLVLAIRLREPPRGIDSERFDWSALRVMLRPFSISLLLFGGLYGLSVMAVESNASLYYKELGIGKGSDIGTLGAARNFGRAAGALLLPFAMSCLPRRIVLSVGILGLATTIAAHALIDTRLEAGLIGFTFGAACGWNDTVFAFLAMEAADPRLAASTFALFMAVTNFSVVGDALFAKGVVTFKSYVEPFLITAGVTLFTLPLIVRLGKAPEPASSSLVPS